MIRNNYNHTVYACFIGYIVQAIVNNFAPLLFLTFQSEYGVSLDRIALLVSINFTVQLFVDLLASRYADRLGYRASIYLAHICSAIGLAGLAVLPDLIENRFVGLLIPVVIYAVGGGLLEVLVSPIVEACPSDHKESRLSLLHSFYCWGHMGVVLISTAFFALFGIANWRVMALLWALVPLVNLFYFMQVPIMPLQKEGEEGLSVRRLFGQKRFWVLMLLMLCSGACELAVSQWASAFAEKGLGISKTLGDLTGPLMFALMMGLSRVVFAAYNERVDMRKYMMISGLACLGCYLLISLAPWPALSLAGCAICGFSVGCLWPGSFSLAARTLPAGGTAMYAFLALAGDFGGAAGPGFVGWISEAAGGSLKTGILAAVILPVLMLVGLFLNERQDCSHNKKVNR